MPDHSNPGPLLFFDKTRFKAVGLQAPTSITTATITAATGANPMVLTLSAAPPAYVQSGTEIVIVGAKGTGCSNMNGVKPVTTLAGTSVTVSYNNTGCTYTASSATVAEIWIMPPVDATNVLCGNSDSTLSFTCQLGIFTVPATGFKATVSGFGITVDNSSTVLTASLTTGGLTVYDAAGAGVVNTVNNTGMTTTGVLTASVPGFGFQGRFSGFGAAIYNNSTVLTTQLLTSGLTVLDSTGSTTVSTVTNTGISTTGSVTFGSISGSTQCLQVNSSGVVSGTGFGCAGASGSWGTWSPSIGNLTGTSATARYLQTGKTVNYDVVITGTTTTSPPSFTVPVSATGTIGAFMGACGVSFGSGFLSLTGTLVFGTTVTLQFYNLAAWSAGSAVTIVCTGLYEVP